MNVRRGFFRLWVVFSILWTVGTIAASYNHIQHEFEWRASVKAAKMRVASGVKSPPPAKKTLSEMSDDELLDVYLNNDNAQADKTDIDAPNPWQKVWEMLAVAVSFPIGTFGLGLTIIWVFAGFRTKKAT